MPVLPSAPRVTYRVSDADHMLSQFSEEEQNAAEESFSVYLRPVELYNLIGSRATNNPSFLTKCLHYKLKEKHKRRVQLSVSLSWPLDDGQQTLSISPLYVLLARPVPTPNGEVLSSGSYVYKRACKLTAYNGAQTVGSPQARFILPDINKLSTEFKSGSLDILLVYFADIQIPTEIDLTEDHIGSYLKAGFCLIGKTPIDFIHFSREDSPKISLGEIAQFTSTVSLKSCYMQFCCSNGQKRVSCSYPHTFELLHVPITITAEELGAKDISRSDLHSYNNSSTDKLPQVLRKKTGEVIFNFKYYNDMLHKTEVTEDYSCPFCGLKCASYKGVECHLLASHDLFNYEFWGDGDYKVVNISAAKITAPFSETVGKLHRREKQFYFCHRPIRRKKSKRRNQNANAPGVTERMDRELYRTNVAGVSSSVAGIILSGPESASPSVPGSSNAPTTLRGSARSGKLPKKGYNHNPRNQGSSHRRRRS